MNIYNYIKLPFINLSSFDIKKVFSEQTQQNAKIVIIALAIFAAAAAIYYLIKKYAAIKVDGPDKNDLVAENPVLRNLSDWAKFFFPEDPLQEYTSELADHINEILKNPALVEKTKEALKSLKTYLKTHKHQDEINSWCNFSGKPEYIDSVTQSYTGSFKTICDFFKDKDFPIEKKMEVLERFEAERQICVPGRVGLLNDICNSMDEPAAMTERLPWLIARYKIEFLRNVIQDVHYLNNIIIKHGIEFGLPATVISAAQADTHLSFAPYEQYYLENYRISCTYEGCLDFLENYINSDLPGREAYRAHILSSLAEQVTDEQVDDEEAMALILSRHEAALENEQKVEKERLLKKFDDNPDSPEATAEWEKIVKRINLKKDPFIDAGMYANYHYRLNPEDGEDNQLTREALELFADDALQNLHVAHASPLPPD